MDSPLKRLSAINVGSPWRGVLPLPDGVIDQADRQVVAFLYAGISSDIRLRLRMLMGLGI